FGLLRVRGHDCPPLPEAVHGCEVGATPGFRDSPPLFGTVRSIGYRLTTKTSGHVWIPALLFPITLSDGHHCERRSCVSNVVLAVFMQGTSEPPTAFPLVGFQPGDPLLNPRIAGRNIRLTKNKDDKAGSISVATFDILRRVIRTLPVAEGCQSPSAVGLLQF